MNQPGIPPDLLRRYLNDQCTADERQQVDAWYQRLDETVQAGQSSRFNKTALFDRIQADITEDASFGQARVRPLWQQPVWQYAAAGVAAILILVSGFLFLSKPGKPLPVASLRVDRAAPLTYANRTRKIQRQALPDGSVVWLNPGATLTLAATFRQQVRAVQFQGEAFFEVAKDAAHPFVIRSGNMTTRVLGTSFNVNAPHNGAQYKVSVVTGRVSVSTTTPGGQRKTVLLTPRQQATYQLTTSGLAKNEILSKPTEKESWQPISLAFDDATLTEAARQLEKAFGVQIVLVNPDLANCRLTVDFNQQRLPEILDLIDKLLGTEYSLSNERIMLTGPGCAN